MNRTYMICKKKADPEIFAIWEIVDSGYTMVQPEKVKRIKDWHVKKGTTIKFGHWLPSHRFWSFDILTHREAFVALI